MTREETKIDSSKNHEFTIKMKFKIGDKVKVKPQFKDDNIYEIVGFEYCTLIKSQFSVIRYCVMDSKGDENWIKEDVLGLYKPQQTSNEKELTEQESNFINSFIWYKPNYGYLTPLTGLNAIHVSKLYTSDNPHFLRKNLFLNPFTNKWIEWTEKFRNELKKHYAEPAKPKKRVSIPATKEELEGINLLGTIVKTKETGFIYILSGFYPDRIEKEAYFFNPDTKCWEDWGGK